MGHSFTIISVFALRNKFDEITERLYMIKNPWGKETFMGKWNHKDKRWTKEYIDQVPYGINPVSRKKIDEDGIFFVDAETFVKSFFTYYVGHYKPGYLHSYKEFKEDDGTEKTMELKFSEEFGPDDVIYIISETYYQPLVCHERQFPILSLKVFLDDAPYPFQKIYSFE